ncbi:MAG: four-carbon acid sugar kinase family protein [Klebsiella huaxiensis]|uniref:D-threonate kinase n=1 Tax=Klebsiella huaxiensis TaxID=2153354 RepID=UPI0026ECF815|nr:four-carbon acid sugar kinase family protein [Klebsiella huaxiensis]WEJ87187.1 MAG: four-carbon acid sugar kinase family protein [Klebsiella huaxiensis]
MNKPISDQQVVILADDFSGANDAGVSLAQAGMRVEVALEEAYQSDAQVLIYNSDSRALTADAAKEKVAALTDSVLRQYSPAWLVKKIDSTLRGNPGAEVMAMQQVTGATAVIIAPAFPAAGRITRDGKCLVNGVLLTDTEFASDPKTPIASADVGALFSTHCQNITPSQLPDALARGSGDSPVLLVVDAQTDADLDEIITHAMQASERPLLVGSAGLCDALSRRLAPQKMAVVLAVVGSMSEIAQKQVNVAAQHPRCEHIFIDINNVFQLSATNYRAAIVAALNDGKHCLVHTCPDEQARHQVAALCERWGLSRAECGERICDYLAALTRDVLQHSKPDGIYVSGGDVAIAVARALWAKGFQIRGRAAGCVPWGYFSGCEWQRPVMTKAGGFGDETTLLRVLHFIEEKSSV